ncbi:MAG: endonuclease III [Legionellales bacterium]|nr:endonuclease III [Legionellales bacterium]
MNKLKRSHIFYVLKEKTPSPTTELIYKTPFELLISVILSAQATDISVNKATKRLFAAANTPEDIISLGLNNLKKHIKTIGLYNNKAKNIIDTCKTLVEKHNGKVPNTRESLENLSGVGRKTANVILNTVFGEPTIAVDTHIFRVSNRTGIATGRNVIEVENKLLRHVPDEFKKDAHHLLILHGRYTCTARNPKCEICIIYDDCEWNDRSKRSNEKN